MDFADAVGELESGGVDIEDRSPLAGDSRLHPATAGLADDPGRALWAIVGLHRTYTEIRFPPAASWHHFWHHRTAVRRHKKPRQPLTRWRGILYRMERTGIEPVTPCLQSGRILVVSRKRSRSAQSTEVHQFPALPRVSRPRLRGTTRETICQHGHESRPLAGKWAQNGTRLLGEWGSLEVRGEPKSTGLLRPFQVSRSSRRTLPALLHPTDELSSGELTVGLVRLLHSPQIDPNGNRLRAVGRSCGGHGDGAPKVASEKFLGANGDYER